MIFIEKTAHFRRLKKTGYTGTDRRTDRQTDTHSYRDARTHLKSKSEVPESVDRKAEGKTVRGKWERIRKVIKRIKERR